MAKKGGASLAEDAPWRVSSVRPVPRISRSPVLSISQTPETDYAISVMKVFSFFWFCFVVCPLQSIWELNFFFISYGLLNLSLSLSLCSIRIRWEVGLRWTRYLNLQDPNVLFLVKSRLFDCLVLRSLVKKFLFEFSMCIRNVSIQIDFVFSHERFLMLLEH